ncbi:MAG: hypothetical protein HN778_10890 [Prolixibacteraceae bacterium]|jgi:hypothetical protein|nr:hypothetical protein [Prolixibacteraceae bacterium]MBT6005548.1 hypothetical protein [Prolixibacteraceae bacterium]MBT6763667.1 hypothetical protein [Prolixibacteraceae bacterium]MBT6999563.1 hypothetical protein [Prolixibacteraceae bacterium]MBT7395327.1 hypothetical protein [Prolixibacteraceae bacterium]
MKKKSGFTAFVDWLKTSEMFARPSKQLPGKWNLVEYYVEPENDLVYFDENRLKEENLFWELEFTKTQKYYHKTNIPVSLITLIEDGTWSHSGNFISLINPNDFRKSNEFQFAIDKNTLKLLKKDALGKIEFFGTLTKTEI